MDDGADALLASGLHASTTVVSRQESPPMTRTDSRKTTAVAQVLLGLATSLVIVGALTPLDPLGPRRRRRLD